MHYQLGAIILFVAVSSVTDVDARDYFPYKAGFCPRPTIKDGLDVKRFFKDRWYVAKSTGVYLFQLGGTCSATMANVTEDGTEINLLHYQYEPLLKTYTKVRGTAQTKFTRYMGIYSPVKYDLFGFGYPQFEVPFVIVDTDYDNWAIMYMCKQYTTGFKTELGWMMTRKRGDKSHLETMEKAQKLIGNEGFIDEVNTDCGANEPSL
uniref:Lipocalin-like protein 5 n=1 Tax=Pristhesancus plagipennis TaxID=1955184 RepID=A0A1Q1NP65_PRIPG|nr:lipocalin-like protein 5 [Pristhesancus plagipennis]